MGILSTQLEKDSNGKIKAEASDYKPNEKAKFRTAQVISAFEHSNRIKHKAYKEFNDMSLIDRMNRDQKTFNAWQEPIDNDPDNAWKSRAVRPIVRNKIISIAAHITANLIFPKIFAQNNQDEEDKDAAEVMRDLMEWRADEADYEKSFLHSVVGALVNPATIVYTEYSQTYRRIKQILADGTWKEKDVLDELYSGFKDIIVPVDELYIENIYESDIQKQGHLIWRRVVSYASAQAKYNTNPAFRDYVRPGVQLLYSDDEAMFYEQRDKDLEESQVEEIIYWNRNEDLKLVFINGVLVTDPDQPNPRQDHSYPFAKTGYELFDEGKFFYYRSLANKASVDEEVVNTLYRMIIDGTYLQLMPPAAVYGDEEVDSSVMAPGVVTSFNEETKLERLNVGNDLNSGRQTLEKVEQSISESSVDKLQGGQSQSGTPPTAFELSRVEQNARVMLGLFGKMIGFLVKDWGNLMISDIKQFATVAEYTQLTTEAGTLKFRNILLPEKISEEGKKKSKTIQFNHELPENPTKKDLLKESFRILALEGDVDSDIEIAQVNPKLFRSLKFKIRVTPDILTPTSDNVQKALNLEAYDRAIKNPSANQEAVYRDLLLGSYEKTRDNPDKYINKESASPVEGQLAKVVGANQAGATPQQ